jgi:hypothetical protein
MRRTSLTLAFRAMFDLELQVSRATCSAAAPEE